MSISFFNIAAIPPRLDNDASKDVDFSKNKQCRKLVSMTDTNFVEINITDEEHKVSID